MKKIKIFSTSALLCIPLIAQQAIAQPLQGTLIGRNYGDILDYECIFMQTFAY
jgi:hypothetical protein